MSPRLIGPAASVLTVLLLVPVQVFPKLPLLLAERFYTGAGWAQIMAMSIYAGLLAGRMADPMTARRLRPRIWLLFSLVFFLQLFLGLAGIEKLLMTGKLHLPVPALIVAGPIYRGSDFFMPILFTITALLVGTAWCSHLCYIGAWDDFCSRGRKEPAQLPGRWSRVRHGILFLVVAVAILLRHFAVGRQTALMLAAVFGLAGVGVMLAASRRLGLMAHCTA
ncbi:MAG TPA: 4Fe-4S binding protein, partial [Candidatus Rifleibacterium sp.]|nr:4Fe-4S binding protein [Candidatus Rifleibacterium sp.]